MIKGRKSPSRNRIPRKDWLMEIGASPPAVWAVKHVAAPIHRTLYRVTGGRVFRWGKRNRNIALLTTTGRRTGDPRTTPVFFVRDVNRFVVCNVKPGLERTNPWVLNLRANASALIQVGPRVVRCRARELEGAELDHYWPQFVALWPVYEQHYRRSGQRSLFVLEPVGATGNGRGRRGTAR